MNKSPLKYYILSWAVVGIHEQNSDLSPSSLQKENETIEEAVEKYVIGYMAFWNIAFIEKEKLQICTDNKAIKQAISKIEQHVLTHPPIRALPKFYIVFLNQPQIGCDTNSLSDVFCM